MPEGFYPASRFSAIGRLDSGQKPAGMADFGTFARTYFYSLFESPFGRFPGSNIDYCFGHSHGCYQAPCGLPSHTWSDNRISEVSSKSSQDYRKIMNSSVAHKQHIRFWRERHVTNLIHCIYLRSCLQESQVFCLNCT